MPELRSPCGHAEGSPRVSRSRRRTVENFDGTTSVAGLRAGYRAVQARCDGLLRLIVAAAADAGGVRR